MSNNLKRYRFYTYSGEGNNGIPVMKTVAVSTYAGKTVKGIAICDPRDTYSESTGYELAAARCNVKVANRRVKRAYKELQKAHAAYEVIQKRVAQMESYYNDAKAKAVDATDELNTLYSKL